MVRLAALTSALALAQPGVSPEEVSAREQEALKATAAWQAIAADLDARVARMLPCDPRTKAAIDQASHASQARLAAAGGYWEGLAAQAARETQEARALLAGEQARAAAAAQERERAEELSSAAVLPGAESEGAAALRQSAESAVQVKARATNTEAAVRALEAVVAAQEARQATLAAALAAFESERARWNGYYAARLARSQTECSLTNVGPAPARPAAPKRRAAGGARGKQK